MTLDTPLSELYGVGKKYEKYLSSNGLNTVRDLLFYFPRAYQNRGDVCQISSAPSDNMPHSFILTVASEPKNALIRRGMNILKFRAFDESGSVTITYFNQSYLKDVFRTGAQFRFWGKISREKRTLCMNSPSYEPYIYEKPLPALVSVYPLFSGVNQKYLTKLQKEIYPFIKSMVTDFMPEGTRQKNGLCTLANPSWKNSIHSNHCSENILPCLSMRLYLSFSLTLAKPSDQYNKSNTLSFFHHSVVLITSSKVSVISSRIVISVAATLVSCSSHFVISPDSFTLK